jgi:serine/threonine protein kinase
MEYHAMGQCWEFEGDPDEGEPRFLYTRVVFWDGDDYFSAELPEYISRLKDLPIIDKSYLRKIPREHIWPRLEDKLTICPEPKRPDVYIKQPRLPAYDGSASLSSYLLEEARICQLLMEKPHKNVARYLGCVVKADRITGLCFQKYAETLSNRLQAGRSVDKKRCFQQVKEGIDHLHALGLVHNDINSDNVMFADGDGSAPVIIDFDSCAVKGHPLPDKRGQMPEGACTTEFENDSFGLDMLRKELNLPREA